MRKSTKSKEALFPRNLEHDPNHVLDGMFVLECFFCRRYKTPIKWDMENHLRELHKEELVKNLPLRGRGINMESRIEFAIDIVRRGRPAEFYDYRTARFSSDINTTRRNQPNRK